VEVAGTEAVDTEQTRLAAAGFASIDERATTCCYAEQDKFWVEGAPDGERWEIYTVLADSSTFSAIATGPTCCTGERRPAAPFNRATPATTAVQSTAACCATTQHRPV
jgi:hypothetical protein